MTDKSIPAEIREEAMSPSRVPRDMRLRKPANQTSMLRWREVIAVTHSECALADLYSNQIMTEDMEELVLGGPELTPDDWRNLVFILERRIDYCETQMALVGKVDKSSGEHEVLNRRHFEGELAAAQALFSKIDQTQPLT